MYKRFISAFLGLVLLFALCPLTISETVVSAAAGDPFADPIAACYDRFTDSIYQANADEKALDQLLEPAIYGSGADECYGKSDAVTAAIFQSELFRAAFLESVSRSIHLMQQEDRHVFMTAGGASWYNYALTYHLFYFQETDFIYHYYDQPWYELAKGQTVTGGNRCDSALCLTVGSSFFQILIKETEMTEQSTSYHLTVRISDEFDFNSTYDAQNLKKYDTSMAKLLTAMGSLLRLQDYFWYSQVELDLTLPAVCRHDASGAFHWEMQSGILTAVDGSIQAIKQPTQVLDPVTDSYLTKYYYELESPVYLLHTDPWYVEYRIGGSTTLYLGPGIDHGGSPLPSLFKYNGRVSVMDIHRYNDPKAEENHISGLTDRYTTGVDYWRAGFSPKETHTYRIENRIAADGTNAIWLLVDGQELGQMASRQFIPSGKSPVDMEDDPSQATGKDFIIRYIANKSSPFADTPSEDFYVQIGNAGSNYLEEVQVAPSCTSAGGQASRCILCGLVTVHTPGEPLPHNPEAWAGYAPTCDKEGLTDGAKCADCGTILQERQAISSLPHTPVTIPGFAPTCKDKGLSDGSKCAVCSKVLVYQQTIENTGHTFEPMPSKSATCTEEGSSGGSWCSVCQKLLMPATTLPALGHNFKNGKCKNCGEPDPDVPVLMGDADSDGSVTYMDAMAALQMAVGLLESNPVCDMDTDNTVTYLDAMQILRLAVGLA